MATETETWLAANTFECRDLKARVSVGQCWANRAKAKELEYPGMVRACLDCEHGFGQKREKPEGEEAMTTTAKCIEEGCEKFRVRNKRCVKHSNAFLDKASALAAEATRERPPVAEAAAEAKGSTLSTSSQVSDSFGKLAADFEGVDYAPAGPSRLTSPPATRSLLYFLEKPAAAPGIFLDFTGHESLLITIQALTDDLNHDLICLLSSLLDGKLSEVA